MENEGASREADSYSRLERRFLGPFRRALSALLQPLVRLLAYLHVPPNLVSSLQIGGGVTILVILPRYPRAAFLLFLTTLLLDGIDGALARATGRSSSFGALYDQFCDHARETLVVAALAAAGALSPLPAVLYPFTYVAFNLTLYLGNSYAAPLPFAVKSYLTLYPAIFLYLWLGINWLDYATWLSLLLMGLVIALGLWRLRSAMAGSATLNPP